MAKKSKTIIHVNRQFIAKNAKYGEPVLPTYIVRYSNTNVKYGYAVKINGPSVLIDPRERAQLNCGARAFIETDSPVEVVDPMTYQEAKVLEEKYAGLI